MTDLSKGKQPFMSLLLSEPGDFLGTGTSISIGDTTLRLNCSSYEASKTGLAEHFVSNHDLSAPDDGCRLVLGLGPTPTSYTSGYCIAGAHNREKEPAITLTQSWDLETHSDMLELGLSTRDVDQMANAESNSNPSSKSKQILKKKQHLIPVVDESSTSARRNQGGYMPALLFAPRLTSCDGTGEISGTRDGLNTKADAATDKHHLQHTLHHSLENSSPADSSTDASSTSTSPNVSQRNHHPKKCMFKGCSKGARGASGLCIGHGGGQRCQRPGCNKGAESRTAFCKAHGGGRRCELLGCTKSAEGKTDYCIAHGGGRRCTNLGCTKAARGKSGLCIKHGGGKRCTVEGCTRSAEGQPGLCISHGGGRRCEYPDCGKGAQGSTKYCKAHGGGRRCIFQGCTKGAEGSTPLCKGHGGGKRCLFEGGGVCPKSVHGGTQFCVAHGGGKRCAVPGCTKSARGRTDCCVSHGGGKRCHFEGCDKSAQGRTDFCKAHGGGKRCTWSSGCDKFARGRSGLCAAHGTMMAAQQERRAGKKIGGMIGPGLFQGLVSSSVTVGSSIDNNYTAFNSVSECVESQSNARQKHLHIPPQVLVPMSMKSPAVLFGFGGDAAGSHKKSFEFVVPDGRVHGGNLLSLLGGSFKNAVDADLV
ncbi:hypothetical protein Cni_G11429 [Canna indica]|uniref:WRKY19-like zinc finger domain-containing protein n=1 Tax=Canna indica TaxID=4628 RepID=A0AAQ3KBT8_9LILI|nr:hypothetical protein Cni_G11429 [Canna indica]